MECRCCHTELDRLGDYCLVCNSPNTKSLVLECSRRESVISILGKDSKLGEVTVSTIPDDGERTGQTELRNYVGRLADAIRRKRPEEVFVSSDRTIIRKLRGAVHYELQRVPDEDPVAIARQSSVDRVPTVVDRSPNEKLGGSHSTLIGGREGTAAIRIVAEHPNVKKVIPGPIETGSSSATAGIRAKATRADENGNIRLLIRSGSTVQEIRIVTTAMNRPTGEEIRVAFNDTLAQREFQ